MRKKPQVVIFFGGDKSSADLSAETGHWMCQYIPRSKYQIKPVRITEDGNWQVPLGNLPQKGDVAGVLENLFQATTPTKPTAALQRLLNNDVHLLGSTLRGHNGDDGGIATLGELLNIPVIGSPASACAITSHKDRCANHLADIVETPYTLKFNHNTPTEEIVEEIRSTMMPGLFVKGATSEGSNSIVHAESIEDLAAAVSNNKHHPEILVQERIPGQEINLSLFANENGKVTALPATNINPKHASYYDHLAKRIPGRAHLQNSEQNDKVVREAEEIAREVWEELGLQDYASFDFVSTPNEIVLLEVNTIPVMSAATPLLQQLQVAGLHPTSFLELLVRNNLR